MRREPGYYWVKFLGEWRIGLYYGSRWYMMKGSQYDVWYDVDFQEIDENRLAHE